MVRVHAKTNVEYVIKSWALATILSSYFFNDIDGKIGAITGFGNLIKLLIFLRLIDNYLFFKGRLYFD